MRERGKEGKRGEGKGIWKMENGRGNAYLQGWKSKNGRKINRFDAMEEDEVVLGADEAEDVAEGYVGGSSFINT